MTGIKLFYFVLLGQAVSLLGSSLTSFGVSVWILREHADSDLQTTFYSLTMLAATLPAVLAGPLVGGLVDRWPRKLTLMLSQIGAALSTLVIAVLYWLGHLSIWSLLWVLPVASLCNLWLQVGFTATTALVVPKDQLSRASGSLSLVLGLVQLLSPLAAGILLDRIGMTGLFVIDLLTFLVGLVTLAMVAIPDPENRPTGKVTLRALIDDMLEAYRYMQTKPGVLGALFLFALVWFNVSVVQALFAPLILSIGTAKDLGLVQTVAGLGLTLGSILMVAWKGPDRKAVAILWATALVSLGLVLVPVFEDIWALALGGFIILAIAPLANTSSQVLWQRKIDPALQGRVFSLRTTIMRAAQPVAFLSAGLMADGFFKPQMAEAGWLATYFGGVWGVGEDRGLALMISTFGLLGLLFVIIAALRPDIREADLRLPDFDEPDQKNAQLEADRAPQ